MTYYDRFYPEATDLQKKLQIEAQMFREQEYKEESVEERLAKLKDVNKILTYDQFYALAPQNHVIAEEEVNAPDHQEH